MADFVAALDEANNQAEQAEQRARQDRAIRAVELAQDYMHHDPEEALRMIERALIDHPNYVDALRLKGKIQFNQGQLLPALETYKQAYEQEHNPSSAAGLDYLGTLWRVADDFWQRRDHSAAVEHYQAIRQILGEYQGEQSILQELWRKTRNRLIDYHDEHADKAYARGNPGDVEKAITVVEKEIESLESLQADSESRDLQAKLTQLRIKKYENDINSTKTTIRDRESQGGWDHQDMLPRYLALDKAYRALNKLEPLTAQRTENRRKGLKNQAKIRVALAKLASAKDSDPEYEAAIQHYYAIEKIEETDYPNLSEELGIAPYAEIERLKKAADYFQKYAKIEQLITAEEYDEALTKLIEDFITPGIYRHKNAAKLFWQLVHFKKHDEYPPPELAEYDKTKAALVEAQKALVEAEKKATTLQDEVAEGERELAQVRQERAEIQDRLVEREDELETVRAEITSLRDELAKTGADLTAAQETLEATQSELNEVKNEAATTREKLAKSKQEATVRQDKLTALEEKIIVAEGKLAQAEKEVVVTQNKLTQTQTELENLRKEKVTLQNHLSKFNRGYEINRVVIPVSLVLAAIFGAIIFPQIANIPGVFVITIILFVLLLVYFGYYIWLYFLPQSRGK